MYINVTSRLQIKTIDYLIDVLDDNHKYTKIKSTDTVLVPWLGFLQLTFNDCLSVEILIGSVNWRMVKLNAYFNLSIGFSKLMDFCNVSLAFDWSEPSNYKCCPHIETGLLICFSIKLCGFYIKEKLIAIRLAKVYRTRSITTTWRQICISSKVLIKRTPFPVSFYLQTLI